MEKTPKEPETDETENLRKLFAKQTKQSPTRQTSATAYEPQRVFEKVDDWGKLKLLCEMLGEDAGVAQLVVE